MKKLLLILICLFMSFGINESAAVTTNISKKECYDAINKGKKVIENNSKGSTFLLIMYKGEAYYVDLFANTDFRCFKILWQ